MNLNNLNLLKSRFGNDRNMSDLIDTLAAINKPPLSMIQPGVPFVSTNGGIGVQVVPHALGATPATYRVALQALATDLGWNVGTIVDQNQVWTVNLGQAELGQLIYVMVTSPGSGYTGTVTATVTGSCVTPATVVPVIAGGQVVFIGITDPGSGYTSAPAITINGTCTTGATASAIVYGGLPVPGLSSAADSTNVYIVQPVPPALLYITSNTTPPILSPITPDKWSYFVYASLDYVVTQPNSLTIVSQPASAATSGGSAAFLVVAVGLPPLTYAWQMSTNSGLSWSTASGGVYTGNTTSQLTINPTTGMNGYQYRCVVQNGISQSAVTDVVTLTVT